MEEVKCPLCEGNGKFTFKIKTRRLKRKTKFEVDCPLCRGKGEVYELNDSDRVDVEIGLKGTRWEYATLHKPNHLVKNLLEETTTVGEAFKKYRRVDFCRYCFGPHVIYKDRIVEAF